MNSAGGRVQISVVALLELMTVALVVVRETVFVAKKSKINFAVRYFKVAAQLDLASLQRWRWW
jgi:hypothetical protein